jgi:1-acyl-sn-glycerol-3-phosphate acyltransferase
VIDPLFNRELSRRRRLKHAVFLILKAVLAPILWVTMRFRAFGRQAIPKRGGAVLVANHVHNADPLLIYAAMPRPILWMTKAEVWRYPIIRWVAAQGGAFAVQRQKVDTAALAHAEALLNDGLIVGLFPEGTRSTTGSLSTPFRGACLLALRAGAPVMPVAIVGTTDLPFNGKKQARRQRRWPSVTVHFGEPFMLAAHAPDGRRYRLEELADAIMIEIARLLPSQMRGIYAGRCDASHPAVQRGDVLFTGPGQPGARDLTRRNGKLNHVVQPTRQPTATRDADTTNVP